MNKGIGIATGKWLLFLGADDELVNNAIENLVENSQSADITYGNKLLRFSSNYSSTIPWSRSISSCG